MCGGPTDSFEDSLEGRWFIALAEQQELDQRWHEQQGDRELVCKACDDTGVRECPDNEFESHEEAGCRWRCHEGATACDCHPTDRDKARDRKWRYDMEVSRV